MRLRLETDYGIRCVMYLAQQTEYVQASKIAAAMQVPENVIPRVLSRLKHSGLVSARSGVMGGHKLGRPADQITMLDIVRCMEDHIVLDRCLEEGVEEYENEAAVMQNVHEYFMDVQIVLENALRSVTVANMMEYKTEMRSVK